MARDEIMEHENEDDSIRAALEAAVEQQTTEATAEPASEPSEPAPKDTSGKHEPVEPAKVEKVAEAPATSPEGQAYERAPASWKPAIREKWAGLDPEIRAEVMRREVETSTALNNSAQSRKLADDFQRTIQPYMQFIQADGASPLQAVDNMMRTAATLRTAAPAQKAAVIADIMQQFGVDVSLLDQQLTSRYSGQPTQQDPNAYVSQVLEQKLAPIQQFMQQMQQQTTAQQQAKLSELSREVSEFETKNEFMEDVRGDVADILELAANRGVQMSLQEAYNKAILLHPQVSEVLEQRKRAQLATTQTAAARKAKQAAASLPSKGAPAQSSEDSDAGDDIRSALVASISRLSR